MQLPWLIYLLTALALVVVVLTRVRLRGSRRRVGRLQTSPVVLHVHTVAGLLGVGTWTAFLLSGIGEGKGDSEVGIVALGLLWVTVVAGLMILVRWMPSRGKHSSESLGDSWSSGPGLSILAHVGMLVGVSLFTWAYLLSKV